ncbi:hypothetical protein [Methylosinus sp. RM1]|uniref:hypothetical protein n=1 Tax=Methylosinus sp. RM1 TaxID=2583817 RepID=UPI003519FB11
MKRPMSLAAALFFATPAFAVDTTGIPICDTLLKRYEECSVELPRANIHAAQKELLEGAMSLRANASNPQLRPSLEKFCADTFEAMKTSSEIKACMSK